MDVLRMFAYFTNSIEKIMEVDSHIGCAMSGLTSDGHTLIDHARAECQVFVHAGDDGPHIYVHFVGSNVFVSLPFAHLASCPIP